mmetsp:Transcript_59846/g.129683  ORF Transcript_59846/g.129683 Transcript_59846/m.129683 type:complete len:565 (+) Transcript_59846:209-1903(+)
MVLSWQWEEEKDVQESSLGHGALLMEVDELSPLQVPSSEPFQVSNHLPLRGLGAVCSGLVGLAERLVYHVAEREVWDEARQHAVKQILEGSPRVTEIEDLPTPLLARLLRSRGYELPGSEANVLGIGSFGRVLQVRRTSDGQLLALKRQFLGESAQDVVPVLRETSILNVLRGASNVVKIEEAFLMCPSVGAAEVWTVLEYFPHNLNRVSHRFRKEDWVRRVIFQVLIGLNSLHAADIVHRDLKPENLLIDMGAKPPETVRVAICDFGMSRSVHGFETDRDGLNHVEPFCRKLSNRVTSSWWRAPEMWGWADTEQMTKQDLKSLDIFALGLVWAGLAARRGVIQHREGVDPPKYRLLEILRNVDLPTDADLEELGFGADVVSFVRSVIAGDLESVSAEMTGPEWPQNQASREALLKAEYKGIRTWVRQKAAGHSPNSRALDLIENATRFSYRKRPSVEQLLVDEYFSDLRSETPARVPNKAAPGFNDVKAALEIEHNRQRTAALKAQQLRQLQQGNEDEDESGGAIKAENAFINRIALNATATIEESVRNVCDRVRAELRQTRR